LYIPTALPDNTNLNYPVIAIITSERNVHNSAYRAVGNDVHRHSRVLNRELFGRSCAGYKVKLNLQQAKKAKRVGEGEQKYRYTLSLT